MRVCEDIIVGYDPDDGSAIIEEQCYDDGSTDTSETITDDVDYSKIYDWNENVDGSKQKLNADGSLSYQDPDGSTYTVKDNIYTTQSEGKTWNYDTKQNGFVDANGKLISDAPTGLFSKMLNAVKANPLAALGTAFGAIKALSGSEQGGYNVPVPKMDAIRQQIEYSDTNRRPGAAGRQYFTDPRFVKQGDAAALTAAQNAANAQATGILAAAPQYAAPAVNPFAGKTPINWNPVPSTATETAATTQPAGLAAVPTKEQLMDPNYKIGMASGGIASARYLQGGTDGMADKIPANIDGEQPAALSHGEFVIPADVVSHLGNGNSEAGADKLYQMMARIRKARTGNDKQGKKINPDKFMPGGLAAAYAAGGSVKGFNGATGSTVATTPTSAGGVPLDTSKTSTLSPWAGDYVTNFLGQGAALANAPMQTYGGPLTAGTSNLQQQGFTGMSEIAGAGFQPNTFTSGTFGATEANKYMNPYLSAALQPQIDEARRQSQITQQANAAKMTQAGAFGGSRGAIMDAETQRSLGANLANITGTGLNTAYDKAIAQFNAEQNRGLDTQKATEESRQFGANYGLKSMSDLLSAGATQRDIEAQGIAADKKQFEEQQAYPFNMVEFQRKLVEGLPIGASTTAVNQDAVSKMQSDIAGLASLYKTLANLGVK
jgi:hypothetical protein